MQGVLPIIKRDQPIYVLILGVLFCTWSACNLANTTKNNDTVTKYVLPAYKKAIDLKLKNPDSTLLLCDYMLRITNENEDADSLRFEIELLKASTILNKGSEDKALSIYKNMLEVQTGINNPFRIAYLNFQIADLLNNRGNVNEAESYLDEALKRFDVKKNKLYRARSFNLKGVMNSNSGRFREAQICFNEALNILENEEWLFDYASLLQNMGNMHLDFKDSILARKYYIKSVEFYIKDSNSKCIAGIYNNIGILYRYENPDSALYYYNQVPPPNSEKDYDINNYVISLFNKANIYKDRGEFSQSRVLFDEVYRICETYQILQGFPRVLISYGYMEFEAGNFSKADDYINQALFWCDSLRAIPLKLDILKEKIVMYSEIGFYKEAFQAQQQFNRIEDSIKSIEIKESVSKIERMNQDKLMMKDKLDKEGQLKSKANKNKKRLIILLSTMMAIILGGGLYYRYRIRKQSIAG